MARVLFVTLPERGHIHPLIGPAAATRALGHEVAFYAPRDVSVQLARAGFDRCFAGDPRPPEASNRGEELAALVRDAPRLRAWIRALLLDTVDGEVPRLERVVRDFAPDVIAADPMAYAVPIVARRTRTPWAGLSSSLNPVVPDDFDSELLRTVRALADDRAALFARHGLPGARFTVCDALSERCNVVFATEELVGPAPAHVELVGSGLGDAPRGDEVAPLDGALDGRPIVYVSFGSQIFHQPRMFELAREALRGEGVQLVCSAGALAGALDARPDVVAVPYAPQLAILAKARVVITHGGANSIMEAHHFGVPPIVTAICNDQFHGARFVERAGTGRALDLSVASPEELRDAVRALLDEGPERAAMRRASAAYRSRGGARRAAELVVACASR